MSPDAWELRDFLTRYDEWIGRDTPAGDQRVLVMSWVHFLQSDPYRGATRRLDLGFDFWFAEVPDAGDDREGVFALYRIHEPERSVTCDVRRDRHLAKARRAMIRVRRSRTYR